MTRHASDVSHLPTGVATGRMERTAGPGPEHERLGVFIGRWLTEGETAASPETPAVAIVANDVYEWLPGGYFVLHTAYGRIGDIGVGGVEIIGYDPATRQYRTHFFDSQGNATTHTLAYRDGIWTWQGSHTRCNSTLSHNGKLMTARHERSDDDVHWTPSMTVRLRKVE